MVEQGEEGTSYSYWMIKFSVSCTRQDLIERIVKLKYPTYDTEIAALANSDPEHTAWRAEAKTLADEILCS